MLIVQHCRLARDHSGIYRLNNFGGSIGDLEDMAIGGTATLVV